NDYTASFQLGHPVSYAFASKVAALLPDEFDHVFFTNSGSEAIDTALKIARVYHRAKGEGQRIRFVSRERAYHGVNIGGVSLSGMVRNRETFPGVIPNVVMMRHTWNEDASFTRGQPENGAELADDLQRMCDTYGGSTIAACFVEPVAGSTGVLVPPKGYLERLRQICDRHGILLVFDEVITGFGRLGAPFASQAFGVTPDIITMAKALTNGSVPMGAVSVREQVYQTIVNAAPENAVEFFHGYTYSAHPVACAAGLATLQIYEDEGLFDKAAALSDYFLDKVWSLREFGVVRDIRGYGLMAAVEVHAQDGKPGLRGGELQKKLFWNGCHVKWTGDSAIVAPPFIATREHVDEIVDCLARTLREA
ncbi:MAG: aminotransferase class III-fold pyridoxal phosphate-dependent enzyme, partial [Pseudomonadota bacterium]|nr:aminotransferase class III-fold pyridoxal phosphate-dependent enzyme [Pseudomonadota bacterium]